MSRALYPKHLLRLTGECSLLQETVLRVAEPPFAAPLVMGNEAHRFCIAEQLRAIEVIPRALILEPAARNTAPAATLAALLLAERTPEALMLVAPSDHVIGRPDVFRDAVVRAAPAAAAGALVCFGITPTRPETGFGYVQCGTALSQVSLLHRITAFLEKPEANTAARCIAAGNWLWNAGLFLFRADTWLSEIERFEPSILDACRRGIAERHSDPDFLRIGPSFATTPSLSIDRAVMERTDRAAVLPVDMEWADAGTWSALWQISERDEDGNVLHGKVITHDVRRSYLRGEGPLITALGVEDLTVIATGDAVLVANRSRDQEVGSLVETLLAQGRPEAITASTEYRPWGKYKALGHGPGYKIKLITVEPGASLSLQTHRHRAEHWIVVQGTARVTRGTETFLLHEHHSVSIPAGAIHRLENPEMSPLRLIEVQSGTHLDEDDIVRLEDTYSRSEIRD